MLATLPSDPKSQRFAVNIALAFLPAALIGVAFSGTIKRYLFAAVPVAMAFIIGGVLILWIESLKRSERVATVDEIKPADAIWIGYCASPGIDTRHIALRSHHHGGLLRGMSRKAATEFSFFLAIPTMFAATAFELFKARHLLRLDDLAVIGVGSAASFVSAAFAVRALIRYVSGHNFKVFAWYRIAFGFVILGTWYAGWVKW